jgi:3-hydroxyisobutyrate dehydrogenase
MNIAILGTGIMGTPMAERLIESGHTLAVYNRTVDKLKPLVAIGAHAFSTPSQAVRASDAVIVMLADIKAINSVLFGSPRVSFRNRTVIQMGTIAPEESMRIAKRVSRLGGEYVECPVLGSKEEAKNQTLILMFGGTKAQHEKWSDFLTAFGKAPLYIGEVGKASGMKLALNQIIAGLGAAFSLSLAFVESSGIDRDLFMNIIRKSALYAPMFDKKWERLVNRNYAGPNFPTKLLLKDVNLFLKEAKSRRLNVDSLAGIRRVLETAVQSGHGDVDYIAIIEAMRAKN